MPMERGRQATMKEIRGLRRASRLRDRSADVSMSADWWSMMTWHKALSKAVVLWLPPTMSQSANLSPSVSTAAWMSLSCFPGHVTVGCLRAPRGSLCVAGLAYRLAVAQPPTTLHPSCTPTAWHAYGYGTPTTWHSWHSWHHANSHHMRAYATTITCHAYATPIPRLHRARARAARRHRAAGPTSSQRACGAGQVQCTRQARRRTSEGAAGYGTEEMRKGEMKDLADGLTLRLRELLAH